MRITNVVYMADLKCQFDLTDLTGRLTNVRYQPSRFPGIVWQDRHIGGNCLIFSNGKINCNGKATSFEAGKLRLRRYARHLQKLGYNVRLTDVKLITASAFHKLSGPLHLIRMATEREAIYEPELFPALVLKKGGVTFSCFHTGKTIITGFKTRRSVRDVIYPTIIELELYTT